MFKLKLKKYADLTKQAEFELLEDVQVDNIKLKKGFITDGATIPRLFVFISLVLLLFGSIESGFFASMLFFMGWSFITLSYLVPPFGRYALAAFAHDYLLKSSARQQADTELKRLLVKMNINPIMIFIIYNGVRVHSFLKKKVGMI